MPDAREDDYIKAVPSWELRRDGVHRITRGFKFRDFKESMGFVNRVAELAESEGHHPDIHISWNRVRLELTTHAVKGLSDNDFIIAARIDGLAGSASSHA